MSQIGTLSAEALTLLKRRLNREWVEVTEDTRPLYRELVAAGLMEPLHSFLRGKEGAYRPTEQSVAFKDS